jgi:hypothetical protein
LRDDAIVLGVVILGAIFIIVRHLRPLSILVRGNLRPLKERSTTADPL